jgi:hypothetical protein
VTGHEPLEGAAVASTKGGEQRLFVGIPRFDRGPRLSNLLQVPS